MTRPFVSSTVPVLEWYRKDAKPSEWSLVLESISRKIVLHHGWSKTAQRRLFMGLDETEEQLFELIHGLVSRITRAAGNTGNLVDFETGTLTLVDLIASEDFKRLEGLRASNPFGEEQPLESFERMFGKFCSIAREINVIDKYVFQNLLSGPHKPAREIFDYLGKFSLKVTFHGVDPTHLANCSTTPDQLASLLQSFESAGITAKFYRPSVPGKNKRETTNFPHLRLIKFDFDGGDPIVAVLDQGLDSFGAGTVNSAQEDKGPSELWLRADQILKVTEINPRFS